jgi:hypothetical protein
MAYRFGYQSQFELNLREAREAVNELVRHIEVSNYLAILRTQTLSNTSNHVYCIIVILSTFVQTQFRYQYDSFNISEIVEGGSMGHGTTVPNEFDIDLVIYSRGKLQLRPYIYKRVSIVSGTAPISSRVHTYIHTYMY